MLALQNHYETSDQFLLTKHKHGVKLIPCNKRHHIQQNSIIGEISNVFNLPYSIYFIDKCDNKILGLNETIASLVGITSFQDAIGRDIANFTDEETAQIVYSNNKNVLENESILITEETAHITSKDQATHFLTYKMPLYDDKNDLLGIFGLSTQIEKRQIAQSIIDLAHMDLLPKAELFDQQISYSHNQQEKNRKSVSNIRNLTSKQIAILELAMLGKTAKQIGKDLDISHRTVEMHIINLKERFSVKSKSALIQLAFNEYYHLVSASYNEREE